MKQFNIGIHGLKPRFQHLAVLPAIAPPHRQVVWTSREIRDPDAEELQEMFLPPLLQRVTPHSSLSLVRSADKEAALLK